MRNAKFKSKVKALSLFSNVGIAETYLSELGIDVESLAAGEIVFNPPSALAAQFDGEDFTLEEWEEIEKFKLFVRSKRDK